MKKATKWAGIIVASAVCVTSVALLAACDNSGDNKKEYTVTYLDGTTVLDTQKVKEGEKATKWTPDKPDYEFVDWYATPNFVHLFEFDKPVTENKSAFALWTSANQSEDTREYYIVGSGTTPILMTSNWGKVLNDDMKMTKTAGKNEYTYTIDLQVGDLFQFAINESWHNQRGVGYLDKTALDDGTEVFSGSNTIGDNSSYRLNIKCEYQGNYTFTLKTHPDDDAYETNHSQYTEANKEAFNINPVDRISWVRNGDASQTAQKVVDYYIKGAGITNWKDMYNAATKMTGNNGVYTLETYLKENEEFVFTTLFTVGTEVGTGNIYVRSDNLDEAGKTYIGSNDSHNMIAKASGTYTFTYTEATQTLSVAFNAAKVPAAADYYIDGTFAEGVADWSGYCFNADYKLTQKGETGVYEIKNVALKADSQIIIQAFKEGSTERGEWGTDGYNGLGSYNYTYLFGGGDNFKAFSEDNKNIKVITAGTYNIAFDSYAKIITIEDANAVNDAYIVGSMTGGGNGWQVSADWKMTFDKSTNTYTITATLAEEAAFGVRIMQGATTTQKTWLAASAVDGSPAGFDLSGSNITCKTAGTYIITCTVTDTAGVITITAAT